MTDQPVLVQGDVQPHPPPSLESTSIYQSHRIFAEPPEMRTAGHVATPWLPPSDRTSTPETPSMQSLLESSRSDALILKAKVQNQTRTPEGLTVFPSFNTNSQHLKVSGDLATAGILTGGTSSRAPRCPEPQLWERGPNPSVRSSAVHTEPTGGGLGGWPVFRSRPSTALWARLSNKLTCSKL